jgi:pre-rRNA-processing protein TSR4
MPNYDSESSDGEDYTETNVLLGYANKQATGDAVSHIGGEPVSRLLPQNQCTWLMLRD